MRVDAPRAGAPEDPVVDDQQLGALGGRELEQLSVRGDACCKVSTSAAPGTCRPFGQ